MLGEKLPRYRRSIEDNAGQVIAGRSLQALHKFREFCFHVSEFLAAQITNNIHRECPSPSPTATRSPAAERTSTETAESSPAATAESAAPSPTPTPTPHH